MSGRDQVLAKLTNLQSQDRAWLIGKLSMRQRTALMDLVQLKATPAEAAGKTAEETRPSVTSSHASGVEDPMIVLRRARASEVAELLAPEPAWLIQAILSLDEWRWKDEVLAQLPPTTRAAVQQVSRMKITSVIREALVKHCALQLPRDASAPTGSKAQSFLKRIETFLVERRLALRS